MGAATSGRVERLGRRVEPAHPASIGSRPRCDGADEPRASSSARAAASCAARAEAPFSWAEAVGSWVRDASGRPPGRGQDGSITATVAGKQPRPRSHGGPGGGIPMKTRPSPASTMRHPVSPLPERPFLPADAARQRRRDGGHDHFLPSHFPPPDSGRSSSSNRCIQAPEHARPRPSPCGGEAPGSAAGRRRLPARSRRRSPAAALSDGAGELGQLELQFACRLQLGQAFVSQGQVDVGVQVLGGLLDIVDRRREVDPTGPASMRGWIGSLLLDAGTTRLFSGPGQASGGRRADTVAGATAPTTVLLEAACRTPDSTPDDLFGRALESGGRWGECPTGRGSTGR